MKVKLLLKFYFNAAAFNGWLDNVITFNACRVDGEAGFEKVAAIVEDKRELCNLMNYLERKFERLAKEDIAALRRYAFLRVGIKNLEGGIRREIKRAVMKFTRRLTYIERHEEEIRTLRKYRAVLNCPHNMP